jgi:F0F1-type ATP synthase membrane subunit b/b'
MPILNRITLILCVHILSASARPANSQHTALPSLPRALTPRRELHDRLNPEYSGTPLVSETTASKSSRIDPGDDSYKEFTHSHSVRRLAHWIGLSSDATFHLCSALNFLVMFALIYWKGYPRLTAALRARSSLIRRTIEEAQILSEEAQRRLAEIESRWAQLDSEIAAIQAVAETGMENEEQALLAATAEDARRILEYSQHEIGVAARRARHELKAFAADMAVSIARRSIRIDERTDRDLIRAFVKELEHSDEFAQTTLETSTQKNYYEDSNHEELQHAFGTRDSGASYFS